MAKPDDSRPDLTALRARLAKRQRLDAFFAAHPEMDEETRQAIRKAPEVVRELARDAKGRIYNTRPIAYDPTRYRWSSEEVWARNPAACRYCYEPRQDPTRHFGWYLAQVCHIGTAYGRCEHDHHDDDPPAIA